MSGRPIKRTLRRRAGEHACGIINDRIEPYGGCKKILQGTHVFVVAGRHLG